MITQPDEINPKKVELTPLNKTNNDKFLFNLNNFDEPEEEEIIEEEIELEPPPPSFSEDELEAAKAVAHANGRNEGILEEKGKREHFISGVLQTVSEQFVTLFAAETYREKQYEEEALKLALEVIFILAPSLNDRLGTEALKNALQTALKAQSEQSEIRVEVHPETTPDIDAFIEGIWPDKESAPRYKVVANNELEKGACSLSWKDGGMIRDPHKTTNDIKTAIESLLVEQVMSKGNSALTGEQNNAIKNQQSGESMPESAVETSTVDQDGEQNE